VQQQLESPGGANNNNCSFDIESGTCDNSFLYNELESFRRPSFIEGHNPTKVENFNTSERSSQDNLSPLRASSPVLLMDEGVQTHAQQQQEREELPHLWSDLVDIHPPTASSALTQQQSSFAWRSI
jgi:hypothetical protein